MNKTLSLIKKILGIAIPVLLFVSTFILFADTFLGKPKEDIQKIMLIFPLVVAVYMGLNIWSLKYAESKDSYLKCELVTKARDNQKKIGLILSIVTIALSILGVVYVIIDEGIEYVWYEYFAIALSQIGITLYVVFATLLAPTKKSLIKGIVVSAIMFVITVLHFIFAFILMFGEINAFTNYNLYEILLLVYAVASVIGFVIISCHGDIESAGFDTNKMLGLITFLFGVLLLCARDIMQHIFNLYTVTGTTEEKFYLAIPLWVFMVLLGVLMVVNVINVVLNGKKSIVTKNYIMAGDVVLGVAGIIMYMIGYTDLACLLLFL